MATALYCEALRGHIVVRVRSALFTRRAVANVDMSMCGADEVREAVTPR